MIFTGTLRAPRLNLAAYRKELDAVLGDAIAHAAFEWLGAVVDKVPVWSGASRATFLPLAHAISYPLSVSQASSHVGRDRVDLGLENASGGIDPGKTQEGRFTFTYSTTLAHLIWNEFHNANIDPDPTKLPPPKKLHDPGPYHFQKLGQEAVAKFSQGVSLPNPFVSFTVKNIRVK